MNPKVSICMPTWESSGKGAELIRYSLTRIHLQTFKDVEVIVADHSKNHEVEKVCKEFSSILRIKYSRTKECHGNASYNSNKSIYPATGEILKLHHQDDYLFHEHALQKIVNVFDNPSVSWMANAYVHTNDRINYFNYHLPSSNPRIETVNTIGTPSCIALRNTKDLPMFDDKSFYYFDCEWYYRMINKFGAPAIINEPLMANYLWNGQVSNVILTNNEAREKEIQYIKDKHDLIY